MNRYTLNSGAMPHNFTSIFRETLSDDPHLTDAEMIELSSGVIEPDQERALADHTRRCPRCAAELETIRQSLASWNAPGVLERREARIGRSAALNPTEERPWWMSIVDAVSLAPLRPAFGALAAANEIGVIHFPIYDGELAAAGLSGMVQRRGDAYYVHLTASPSLGGLYSERQVEVAVLDPESGRALINRKTSFDQFILLGTDLQVDTHKIAARLIP